MKLSIGQAWDEAKQILRTDGSAIIAVVLALQVLPGAVMETIAPSTLRTGPTPVLLSLLGLLSSLLAVAGQVAVSRIGLGPSTTVGAALGHAFRRMPVLFAALLLMVLPFALVLVGVTASIGGDLQAASVSPQVSIPLTLVLLAGLFVFIRLLFITPLAADTRLGPIGLLKGAWRLSQGRALKLILLVLLLGLVALVLVFGLGGALSAVIVLALGSIAPGNLSALLVALLGQVLSAVISVCFALVVCRLYVQARQSGAGVSVPDAGGR